MNSQPIHGEKNLLVFISSVNYLIFIIIIERKGKET